MDIRKIKISDIKIEKYNPRVDLEKDSDEFKNIDKSLSTFGMLEPVVVNKNGNILISGHQRLKVLRERKVKEVDVLFVDLDKEKEKVLNLALNKIKGIWDEEKLAKLLEELTVDDLELAGYSEEELELLLNDINSYIDEDLLEKETNSEPKTFNITLVFSLDNKDSVEKYIKGFEKNNVVQEMIDFIEKRKEDM